MSAKSRTHNRTGSPSQIHLIRAMSNELTKQGFPFANPRQFNALIEAANLIVDEFGKPDRPSTPASGLKTWLESDDTGSSSLEVASRLGPLAGMFEYVPLQRESPVVACLPSDPDDLGRIIRLLAVVPELRPHLPAMADLSPGWAALVAAWGELESLYLEELPSGSAPKCYARMTEILEGVTP